VVRRLRPLVPMLRDASFRVPTMRKTRERGAVRSFSIGA
jgi:hypothetical protein